MSKTKVCSKCKIEKPVGEFSMRNKKTGKLHNWCKSCFNIYNKSYSIANHDKILKLAEDYRYANKDKIKDSKKKCYVNNKEHYTQRGRETYIKNKVSIRVKQIEYLKTPAGKIAEPRVKHNRRRREKTNIATLTAKQWDRILEMQNNRCAECGREFNKKLKPTKDHIIPVSLGGGLTFGNVQALCHQCNSKKHANVDFMRAIDNLLVKE